MVNKDSSVLTIQSAAKWLYDRRGYRKQQKFLKEKGIDLFALDEEEAKVGSPGNE